MIQPSQSLDRGPSHTAEDRAALFEDMFAKIMRRDAFVPVKNERLELDVAAALQACRQDFITAESDEKLIYAILRKLEINTRTQAVLLMDKLQLS